MKTRNGHVSNSSSSSFIVAFKRDDYENEEAFMELVERHDYHAHFNRIRGNEPHDGRGFPSRFEEYRLGIYSDKLMDSVYKLTQLGYNVSEIEVYNPPRELFDLLTDSECNIDKIINKELKNENP